MTVLTDQLALEFNRLRGHLLGLVEAVGLPPVQEQALKSTIKNVSYEGQGRLSTLLSADPLAVTLEAKTAALEEVTDLITDLADEDEPHAVFACSFLSARKAELEDEVEQLDHLVALRKRLT